MDIIYDFETLSQDVFDGVVLNLAIMEFDPNRFTKDPYNYEELVKRSTLIKFDVEEQVKKYGRKIDKETLGWWKKQSKESQKQLTPNKTLDISIDSLYNILIDMKCDQAKHVWSRGNSFDPVLLDSILKATGKPNLKNWWAIRDTRSFLDGMLFGSKISNKFVPKEIENKFVSHDSRHDIAMDVYRMQYIVRVLYNEEN
jgi:hypothetical protein